MKELDTIVGLGKAGCEIACKFKQNKNFSTFFLDTEQSSDYIVWQIDKQKNHVDYENLKLDLSEYFSEIGEEILFIVGGSGTISGASLNILKQIKHKKIHILYVFPNLDFLSVTKKLQHNVVYGVLQEYARSNVFKSFNIVSETKLSNMIPGITLLNKFDKIDNFIYTIVNSISYFLNQKFVMGTEPDFSSHYQIGTFGVMDCDTGEEQLLFDLQGKKEKHYVYVVSQEKAENDVNMVSNILETFKEKSKSVDRISFSVYTSNHENSYCYILAKTFQIQEKNS